MRNADAQLRLRGNVDPSPSDPLMREVSGLLHNASALEVQAADALGKRNWPAAITALRQALQLAPDNAFTHLNLGTALFQTGDAVGALAEFREAVRLSPALAKAQYGIGIVTEAAGRDAEAVDAFAAAVKDDPDYAEARLSLGDVRVSHQVVSFLKRAVPSGEVLGEEPLDLPPRQLRTRAVWWTADPRIIARTGLPG
jgi:tetratricopeptide (TPR) repeat protein